MKSVIRFLPVILFALALLAKSAFALPPAEVKAGRALLKRYADVIVSVEMVVTMKGMQGDRPIPAREQKREVNGTFVSATGLTVLSLGSIDPRGGIPAMMMGQQIRYDEPEFKEVKLRLANGTELPARVVLKDADLDLAFIAPETVPEKALPFVNLASAAKAEILATYFDISRGSKQAQRVPLVRVVNVTGMISKPRKFLLATDYSMSCPVFDAEGNVLGLTVRHVAGGQSAGLIILPAADVADIAKQAAVIKIEPVEPSVKAATEEPAAPKA